jgi:hypothetical protein
MNEPTRLRDLGSEGADLLRAARRPRPMPVDVRARTAARVAALAATPLAVGATAKWLSGKTLAWFLGFGLLGAAVGVGAYAMRGNNGGVVQEGPQINNAPPLQTPSPSPSPSPGPNHQVTEAPTPTPIPATSPATPKPSVDTLAEENALLDPVRGKVEADPAAVLAAADAHRKKFPSGQLAADREYLAVRALKKLGRDDEAKKRGDAFLQRFPSSPYAIYVRKLIQ